MNSLTCAEVQEAATEYALGILPADEARVVSAHLLACPDCRREVDDMRRTGELLLELIPGTEPPLGFDHKVLNRIVPRRRRLHLAFLTAAAAAVVAAAIAAAVTLGGTHHHARSAEVTAAFQAAGGRDVGSVYIGGSPAWIWMTVHQASSTGTVSCQLIEPGGKITTVGTFELVDGSGTWKAPDPAPAITPTGARLIGSGGAVIATAHFKAG
jgi:predicted anti-sigma-YlaC factor YlaD